MDHITIWGSPYFHLCRPMKDGLCGQNFPNDNNFIITVKKKPVVFAGADFYKLDMQTFQSSLGEKAWILGGDNVLK